MPDFVDQAEATDQDPDRIGCGMAFISWLLSEGQTQAAIARAIDRRSMSGIQPFLPNAIRPPRFMTVADRTNQPKAWTPDQRMPRQPRLQMA